MRDPYVVLGVAKTASQADIKKAFRSLAQKYHPDRHEGDKSAEERFKEVNAAYKLLSDADLRQRYDRGAVDANGEPTFRSGWSNRKTRTKPQDSAEFGDMFRDFASGRTGSKTAEDIFSDIFSGGKGGFGAEDSGFAQARQGPRVNFWLELDFVDAAKGMKKKITLPTGKEVNVTIPPGAEDGQVLRLKGQGMPGLNKGPYGDAMVELSVKPDPIFTRKDKDIHAELPVTVQEALLGAKVPAQTIHGAVQVSVPAGANSGTILRLKGKGIPEKGAPGDHYVKLKVMLPADNDEFTDFVKKWSKRNDYQVRPKGR